MTGTKTFFLKKKKKEEGGALEIPPGCRLEPCGQAGTAGKETAWSWHAAAYSKQEIAERPRGTGALGAHAASPEARGMNRALHLPQAAKAAPATGTSS